MVRIDFADPEDLPEERRESLESLSPKQGLPEKYHHLIESPVRNIYRTIGRSPPLLVAFREFGRTVWEECGLEPRQRELVILATGRALDAAYEWHQHVRVGLSEGLTPEEIAAIGADRREAFEGRDRALVEFAAGFATGSLDVPTLEMFVDYFDERTAVGTGVLVGLYSVIGLVESGFDLGTEEPFVGWGLDGL
ncbi:carboxymuconolactone decarboxylase family protein [Salinirubellus sp. GCM10025818]|uniref:carboxymuconolactone decarboxylase family protein n=1 Tax=Salinirubellus TaxID=2162630 RepID=UPI0030D03C9A